MYEHTHIYVLYIMYVDLYVCVCVCVCARSVCAQLLSRETWVWSLGQEDPLEKWMATHSSILAWEIPWTEGPGGLQSMGLQRVRHDWATNTQ